eukprot:3835864-Alexandrium_andersonii.AAC.1
MRGLRVIAGTPLEGPRSTHDRTDVQVCQQLSAMHVRTRVWRARLMYLPRLIKHGGPVLNALVQATPVLRQQVLQDLAALRRCSTKLAALPPPEVDPVPWFELMLHHPGAWRSIVAKAASAFDAESQQLHSSRASSKPGRGDAPVVDGAPIEHICYDCGRSFKAQKGLVMHKVRAHGYKSEHGIRVCTEWCPVCLRYFHDVRRVVHHVTCDAHRCGQLLLSHVQPWTHAQ